MEACEPYRSPFNSVAQEYGLPATLLMSLAFFHTGCNPNATMSKDEIAKDGLQFGIMRQPGDLSLALCLGRQQHCPSVFLSKPNKTSVTSKFWTDKITWDDSDHLKFFQPLTPVEANIRQTAFYLQNTRDGARWGSQPTRMALRYLYGSQFVWIVVPDGSPPGPVPQTRIFDTSGSKGLLASQLAKEGIREYSVLGHEYGYRTTVTGVDISPALIDDLYRGVRGVLYGPDSRRHGQWHV